MKRLLLRATLLLVTVSTVLADTPAIIAADYHLQSAQAVQRVNEKLEQSAAPLAARLLQQGDAAGAQQITQEVRAKTAGELVRSQNAGLMKLFVQYDQARAKAIAVVQKASIARIDAMLQTPAGAKLDTLAALGKLRTEIDADTPVTAAPLPLRWTYHRNAASPSMGDLIFNPDGTWSLIDADPKSRYGTQRGGWVQAGKNSLHLTWKGAVWKMTYDDKSGTIDRPDIGKRHLKAASAP
ncbi:hypothetical protein [Prosthecobacter fluviatilis]|uniref:Uncharacterized protein n=1 Tax=Prosthecobacter fluviatilis TaxID=445931 RepID=A0ABW0KXC9_9BACT